jgi:GAF domain-containing protein
VTFSDDSMRELAALSGVVLGQDDLPSTLQEITRIAVRAVPVAEGASVTATDQGRPATVVASDEWAKSLDEMQYVEHEGPCLDCWRSGTVYRVRDLAADTRWPSYGPRAAAAGARSSVSLPLSSEGKVVGALNFYSRTPDSFTPEAVAVAELIAAHAGLAIQVATAFFGQRELGRQLREAMESRAVIEQAKGVLMAQHKVTADAAFDLLRVRSQRRNVKLRLVAQEVVDTGVLDQPD